ncbi:hypothetical protein ACIQNG_33610 [Streptomyces sp. NPDC091377]|uniref:hypothetical protein n=1 Tax=Streptomyces sp. NPDC091377 TaxID=3365995 RepID=UPI003825F093
MPSLSPGGFPTGPGVSTSGFAGDGWEMTSSSSSDVSSKSSGSGTDTQLAGAALPLSGAAGVADVGHLRGAQRAAKQSQHCSSGRQ